MKEENNNEEIMDITLKPIPLLTDTTVCFIIPSHPSREEYIIETINSINQVMENSIYLYNIIIVRKHQLLPFNINDGIEEAKLYGADYIKIVANDDLLFPGFISCIEEMERDKTVDFLHSNNINYNTQNDTLVNYIPSILHPTFEELKANNVIHGNSVLYRSRIFNTYMYDTDITIHSNGKSTAEEYFYHLLLLSKGYKIGYVDTRSGIYRIHNNQKSIGLNVDQNWRNEIKQRIQKHNFKK